MITGAHFLFYSTAPAADRQFLQDVLRFPSVDAGHGWLIFRLPAAELAVHPSDDAFTHGHAGNALAGAVLYLMCDDLRDAVKQLERRGVRFTDIDEAEWGNFTTFALPSGAHVGLYQPKHVTALDIETGR